MKNINKHIKYTVLLLLLTFSSCDQLKQVDRVIKKTFSQLNRFERQKNNYSKRLGLGNKNNDKNSGQVDNSTQFNTINQKNIINEYGYLFEIINGVDPGKVIDNTEITGPAKVFSVSDSLSNHISKEFEVFGWHPYWMKSKWKNYPYNLLSTISYFSYKVDPSTGDNQNPSELSGWTDSEFVKIAKQNKTRVLLTVSLHGEKNMVTFLDSDYSVWETLFSKVSELVLLKDGDGIDINFENVPASQRKNFLKFVKEFKIYLHKEFYKKNKGNPFVSLSLPPSVRMENYSVKKLSDLVLPEGVGEVVNLFIIMGYDFHSNSVPGATSPLQSENNQPSLSNTLKIYDSFGADKNKTILALPYYGLMYNVEPVIDSISKKETDIKATIERKLTYQEINDFFIKNPDLKYQIDLDAISMSKQISMVFDDNTMKEIFYDDSFTLSKKYAFAMTQGLKGVGLWALGYDSQRYELWNLIDETFSTTDRVYVDPIGEVNGFPIRFAKSLVKDKNIYVVIIIFLLFSVIIAALILLNDYKVRERITSGRINSLLFLTIGYIFLIPTNVFINDLFFAKGYGIYIKSEFNLYIAMFIGAFLFYLGSKITIKNKDKP